MASTTTTASRQRNRRSRQTRAQCCPEGTCLQATAQSLKPDRPDAHSAPCHPPIPPSRCSDACSVRSHDAAGRVFADHASVGENCLLDPSASNPTIIGTIRELSFTSPAHPLYPISVLPTPRILPDGLLRTTGYTGDQIVVLPAVREILDSVGEETVSCALSEGGSNLTTGRP